MNSETEAYQKLVRELAILHFNLHDFVRFEQLNASLPPNCYPELTAIVILYVQKEAQKRIIKEHLDKTANKNAHEIFENCLKNNNDELCEWLSTLKKMDILAPDQI
jgi:hypothetical protein